MKTISQHVLANNQNQVDIWKQASDKLRGQLTQAQFDFRIRTIQPVKIEGDIFILSCPFLSLRWLEHQLKPRILATVQSAAPNIQDIKFVAKGEVSLESVQANETGVETQAKTATLDQETRSETKGDRQLNPTYLPIEEFLDSESELDNPEAELRGVYHDKRNEIIQPYKVELHTQYFRKQWRPLLGPLLSELVRELRQRCHYKTKRNTFKTTYKSLAEALGVSERTVLRVLKKDESGAFKNEYLNYFIKETKVLKQSDGKGAIRNLGTLFVVYLDEPLTPEDEAKIRD